MVLYSFTNYSTRLVFMPIFQFGLCVEADCVSASTPFSRFTDVPEENPLNRLAVQMEDQLFGWLYRYSKYPEAD